MELIIDNPYNKDLQVITQMKNSSEWVSSKYVYIGGKLCASRDIKNVGISSRLITDIIASYYDTYLKQYAKGKLIDLGCGYVPLYESYREYITDNICVDWADTLHKNKYLDYELNLTKELPFKDQEFDTIILSDVLEHIPEPMKLWNEMERILKVDGTILINVPFYYWLHEAPHDYYRYTEYALRRYAELSNLEVVLLESIGGVPEILADILAKTLRQIPLIGGKISSFIQTFVSLLRKTNVGKKVSEKTGTEFPLGYFLIVRKSNSGVI